MKQSVSCCLVNLLIGLVADCAIAPMQVPIQTELLHTSDTRLVDGPTSREGRLEVYHDGQWGTVCDDGFDDIDAKVACYSMGFGYNGTMQGVPKYGSSSGVIWIDDLGCTLTDTSIHTCNKSPWGSHNCQHGEDVSIRCNGDSSSDRLPITGSQNNGVPQQQRAEIGAGELLCSSDSVRVQSSVKEGTFACLRASARTLSWEAARSECQRQSAHLVVLTESFRSESIPVGFTWLRYRDIQPFLRSSGLIKIWLGLYGDTDPLMLNYQKLCESGSLRVPGDLCGAVLNATKPQFEMTLVSCEQETRAVCVKPATSTLLSRHETDLNMTMLINGSLTSLYFDGISQTLPPIHMDSSGHSLPSSVIVQRSVETITLSALRIGASLSPGIMIHIGGLYDDHSLVSDERWKCIDARNVAPEANWTSSGFDDSAWPSATLVDHRARSEYGYNSDESTYDRYLAVSSAVSDLNPDVRRIWARNLETDGKGENPSSESADLYPVQTTPYLYGQRIYCRRRTDWQRRVHAQCGEDWLWSAESHYCYRPVRYNQMVFREALNHCKSLGGTLATPDDELQFDFIRRAYNFPPTDVQQEKERTFWIGLYANGTTASGEQRTYTYSKISFSQNGHRSGCLATRIIASQQPRYGWYETACEDTLEFVCQKPKKSPGETRFISQPSDTRISMNTPLSTAYLRCQASNFHPNRSVVWGFFDGSAKGTVFFENGTPPSGFNLDLIKVGRGVGIESSQGYYYCVVQGLAENCSSIVSKRGFVTVAGVATLRVMVVTHDMSPTITNEVEGVVRQLLSVEIFKLSAFSNDLTSVSFTIYTWLNINDGDNESPSSRTRSSDINQDAEFRASSIVYRTVVQALDTRHALLESVTVRRTDACADAFFDNSITNNVTFPDTPLGGTANSRESCVFDGKPLAVGRCIGDFITGGSWIIDSYYVCDEKNAKLPMTKSKVTDDLSQLYKEPITGSNMKYVTSSLSNLTQEPQILTPLDVSYATSLLQKIVARPVEIGTAESLNIVDVVDNLASVNSAKLLEAEDVTQACSRIISSLDSFADNVVIPRDSSNFSVSRPNVAVNVHELSLNDESSWIYGIGIDGFNVNGVDGLETFNSPSVDSVEPANHAAAIVLSRDALTSEALSGSVMFFANSNKGTKLRVSFTVHRDGALFQQRQTVNSAVLSASVSGVKVENLTEQVTVIFRLSSQNSSLPQRCAFWDVGNGSTGARWSTEGVETDASKVNVTNTVVCRSRHLTNFAVLAGFNMNKDTTVAKVLTALSLVGVCLSIIGLTLSLLSQLVLYKTLRRTNSTLVLMHLSVSLLVVNVLVIAGLDKVDSPKTCKTVAALLLYFLLVSFAWMLVEAVIQYLKFVVVFNTYTSKFMLKTTLPAYIVPGLIVALVVILDVNGVNTLPQTGVIVDDNGVETLSTDNYCWLSGVTFYIAFLLPLGLIMITNIVLFVLIVKGLTCDRGAGLQSNQSKHELVKLQVMALICCFLVMGLTWVFALLAFGDAAIIMHFLFCIFNSLQGFLIFVFLNVREPPVRQAWLKLYRCCGREARRLSVRKTDRNVQSGTRAGQSVDGTGRLVDPDTSVSRAKYTDTNMDTNSQSDYSSSKLMNTDSSTV